MSTGTIEDYDAIAHVCQLYIDGGARGDAVKLREAFHPDARMFGNAGGHRLDIPIEHFFDLACKAPIGSGGNYRARILSVEQTRDAAVATIAEDGCWGQASFIDFMSLARVEGVWKIVTKTVAHTGGEIPA